VRGPRQPLLSPADFALLLDANDELQGCGALIEALRHEYLATSPDGRLLKGAYMLNQYLWWPPPGGADLDYMRVKIVVPRSGWRYGVHACSAKPAM
jgi:hypothetical protein